MADPRLHFWLLVMDACAAIHRWSERAGTYALTRAVIANEEGIDNG